VFQRRKLLMNVIDQRAQKSQRNEQQLQVVISLRKRKAKILIPSFPKYVKNFEQVLCTNFSLLVFFHKHIYS
jgi:hypothetical protein